MRLNHFFLSLLLAGSMVAKAQVFTESNFVDELLYQGNGMITVEFDHAGRMYVQEKQGRLLQFRPNPSAGPFLVNYEYFENPSATNWSAIPNFSTLTPQETGVVSDFTLAPANRGDNYAFRYTATLPITTAGGYTFYLTSDDGSRLYVDNVLVVDHDGPHGNTTKSNTTPYQLSAGNHALRVEYFEAGGGEGLRVEFSGPGIPQQRIASSFGPYLPPAVILDISGVVNAEGERGFLGLALDPDFVNNRYLYTLYSTDTDQRVTRFTATADFLGIVPGSEKILLEGLPNTNTVHKSGDIAFRPGEPFNLYVALGDDGERYIVGDMDIYNGKILRIDAATGKGLTDNPFYTPAGGIDSVRSRIWAYRFRNAFRFAFDPAAPIPGVMYISENGDGTDRVARIMRGADGAWPTDGYLTDSAESPVPWRKILYAPLPSLTGIEIVRGGPFAPNGPVLYNARYGANDRKEVRRWQLTGANLDTLTPVPADNGQPWLDGYTSFNIVDLRMGPDGALYYTDSNQSDSLGTGYRLGRIRYIGGTAPVAAFTVAPAEAGDLPFQVSFTDGSTAPGSTIQGRTWDFGDGNVSTQTNPVHTYTQPGIYTAKLTVTNALGLVHTATRQITARRVVTLNVTAFVRDGRTAAGTGLAGGTELRFYQADGVTPAGAPLAVPPGGFVMGSVELRLTSNDVVVSAGEPAADGVEAALVGLRLPAAQTSVSREANFCLSDTLLRGRITDTLGQPAPVDIGLALGEPDAFYGLANGRDSLAAPFSGVNHRVTADVLGYYHLPIRLPDSGTTAFLGTGADTGTATNAPVQSAVYVPSRTTRVVNLVTGLYDGGTGADSLIGQPDTPNVDFATQIQPIFTAYCAACHSDIATNSGGLDLQAGVAWGELVGRLSTEAPGVKLVEPGSPARSYLMEKINCAQPQVGTRMRPNDPMSLPNQKLIADWITQLGALDQVEFTSAQFTESEGAVTAVVELRRTGGGAGAVSVGFATGTGGTATAGADFTASSATVNWADQETGVKTVNVPLLADTLAEGTEWVELTLGTPTGSAALGRNAAARLYIRDGALAAWRAERLGAAANTAAGAPGGDFDNDALSNLLEYALLGDPAAAEPGQLAGEVAKDGLVHFEFPYNPAATEVNWRVLGAAELELGFEELAAKPAGGAWTGAEVEEFPEEGRARLSIPAPVPDEQLYFRLEVTQ
jgi:PKD repeat protein